jgi:beta-phosphoglucomutase-like phosphatase (HAD superfamily)
MSFSNSSYDSKNLIGIKVSETVRLQNETDSFTKKLEHEKRQLMIVEDQIKQAMAEIEEKNELVKSIKPSKEEMKKRNAGIAVIPLNLN